MTDLYHPLGTAKDTGGVWAALNAQMAARPAPAPDAGLGLWGLIVAENVGGLWDAVDHETVLLHREQIRQPRDDVWENANDETLILPREGLLPIWQAVLARTDAAGAMDADGTLRLLRPDAANLWQQSADETLVLHRPSESVFSQQIRPRDLTTFRPQRIPGYALKRLTDARGEMYWILKNLRTDAYLRLNAEQVFLWEQMDGDATVQDIAVAYMLEHGKLAIAGLIGLLEQLQDKGFIAPLVDVYGALDASVQQRGRVPLWRQIANRFVSTEIAVDGIDGIITRSYRGGGHWLFSAAAQWIMLAVIVAGGVVFLALAFGLIERSISLVGSTGLGAAAAVVSLYALQFITLVIHEWAHAAATKHYGREVRRGGFLIYLGMPAAFVDTTDIWMEPRRPRITVSWAGPHSGFVVGGLASLALLAGPGPLAGRVLYQFAFLTYMTSFMNLNPLLKLDGYYILMDWLEIPRLRERSLAFVVGPLWGKLRGREAFTRDERIFATFGLLAAVWTAIAAVLGVLTLGGTITDIIQTPSGLVISGVLLVLALLLVISRRVRRRRA